MLYNDMTCYKILARKIIKKDNPRDQKSLGDRVIVKDSWENKREKVLYVVIYDKFSQNPDLGRLLLASGNRQLYEATGEKDYGCGIGLKSSKWITNDWDGMNTCGNLMKVRDELAGKIDIGDISIDDVNQEDVASTHTSVVDDLGETYMEVTTQSTSTHPSEGDKTVVAENTLVEIASQTMTLASDQTAAWLEVQWVHH